MNCSATPNGLPGRQLGGQGGSGFRRALQAQLAPREHEQLAAAVKLLSRLADFSSNGKEGERWTG
jgi:hypothetical protein